MGVRYSSLSCQLPSILKAANVTNCLCCQVLHIRWQTSIQKKHREVISGRRQMSSCHCSFLRRADTLRAYVVHQTCVVRLVRAERLVGQVHVKRSR